MKICDLVITRLSDSLGEVTEHQRLVDKHGLINSLQVTQHGKQLGNDVLFNVLKMLFWFVSHSSPQSISCQYQAEFC